MLVLYASPLRDSRPTVMSDTVLFMWPCARLLKYEALSKGRILATHVPRHDHPTTPTCVISKTNLFWTSDVRQRDVNGLFLLGGSGNFPRLADGHRCSAFGTYLYPTCGRMTVFILKMF